ncbi:MAG: 30S ribosomal protein S9 [Candidatus Shikimatogenerans bostrichidophilus]|nr:MAG: 30S ribosomal protein S9 [Candidatus Shikimatogenerans bostrichidophilus]
MKKNKKYYHNIGKRKTSIALIYIYKKKKKKKIIINNKDIKNYFNNNIYYQNKVFYPLKITNNLNKFYIIIKVKGGGYTGQSEAISLGISKILSKLDKKYFKILKINKLLTRNSKIVERKKYGRKKSRKKFQFSKR